MIVIPVWKIGWSQSLHLHGTTHTRHTESSVHAQELEVAGLFQGDSEAALLVTVLIN
jgi:hypothetical protein